MVSSPLSLVKGGGEKASECYGFVIRDRLHVGLKDFDRCLSRRRARQKPSTGDGRLPAASAQSTALQHARCDRRLAWRHLSRTASSHGRKVVALRSMAASSGAPSMREQETSCAKGRKRAQKDLIGKN